MVKDEINALNSENGVLATLIFHPDYIFYSEQLQPEHFSRFDNRAVYTALMMMAENNINTVDAYNIIEVLNSTEATRKKYLGFVSIESLHSLIGMADMLARHTPEEYLVLVNNVLDAAFRRDTMKALQECQSRLERNNSENIEQEIYELLDDVMSYYVDRNEIKTYPEVVDACWKEIQERQGFGYAGIPFKFPTLNDYVTIERGELVVFGAEAKQGKSMMLLNCAVDLLKQGKSVLYLDSELNTRMFTARILSNLTGIEYRRLTSGNYSPEEGELIEEQVKWLHSARFTHLYLPTFDIQNVFTAVKRIEHKQDGLDVLIVDYFKSSGDPDAFATYQELGRFIDFVKNRIAGTMGIAAIGAAQATTSGHLADSAKIARNASTICMLSDKTPEEIEIDGPECGNKKLRVVFNRNGMQMSSGEYIDMRFDGNHILYEEAVQHAPHNPF